MKTIRIDDAVARGLITNTSLWATYPYLKTLSTQLSTAINSAKGGGCGACGRRNKAQQKASSVYEQLRKYLKSLNITQKKDIKKTLGADTCKMIIKEPNGMFKEYTW